MNRTDRKPWVPSPAEDRAMDEAAEAGARLLAQNITEEQIRVARWVFCPAAALGDHPGTAA